MLEFIFILNKSINSNKANFNYINIEERTTKYICYVSLFFVNYIYLLFICV